MATRQTVQTFETALDATVEARSFFYCLKKPKGPRGPLLTLEEQVVQDLQHGCSQRKIVQRVNLSLFYVRKIAHSRRAA